MKKELNETEMKDHIETKSLPTIPFMLHDFTVCNIQLTHLFIYIYIYIIILKC